MPEKKPTKRRRSLRCTSCGKELTPRKGKPPRVCPVCRSPQTFEEDFLTRGRDTRFDKANKILGAVVCGLGGLLLGIGGTWNLQLHPLLKGLTGFILAVAFGTVGYAVGYFRNRDEY